MSSRNKGGRKKTHKHAKKPLEYVVHIINKKRVSFVKLQKCTAHLEFSPSCSTIIVFRLQSHTAHMKLHSHFNSYSSRCKNQKSHSSHTHTRTECTSVLVSYCFGFFAFSVCSMVSVCRKLLSVLWQSQAKVCIINHCLLLLSMLFTVGCMNWGDGSKPGSR